MIPCPDCQSLCGVRDAALIGEDLFYVCSSCLRCFDVVESLAAEDLEAARVKVEDMDPPRRVSREGRFPKRSLEAASALVTLDEPGAPSPAEVRAPSGPSSAAEPYEDDDWDLPTPLVEDVSEYIHRLYTTDDVIEIYALADEELDEGAECSEDLARLVRSSRATLPAPPPAERASREVLVTMPRDLPPSFELTSLRTPPPPHVSPSASTTSEAPPLDPPPWDLITDPAPAELAPPRAPEVNAVPLGTDAGDRGRSTFSTFTDFSTEVEVDDCEGVAESAGRFDAGARWALRAFTAASAMAGLAAAIAYVTLPGATYDAGAHRFAPPAAPAVAPPEAPPRPPAPLTVGEIDEPASPPSGPSARPVSITTATQIVATTRAAPTRPEVMTKQADSEYRAGNLTRAAELYEAALTLSPSFIPARLGIAAAEWDLGKRESARSRYRAVVSDAPSLAPPIARERAR